MSIYATFEIIYTGMYLVEVGKIRIRILTMNIIWAFVLQDALANPGVLMHVYLMGLLMLVYTYVRTYCILYVFHPIITLANSLHEWVF